MGKAVAYSFGRFGQPYHAATPLGRQSFEVNGSAPNAAALALCRTGGIARREAGSDLRKVEPRI